MTRLYFHNATNVTAGLPTTEQSTLTATQSSDPATTNRSMNETIGTGQVARSLTITSTAALSYYYTRFVSAPLTVSSISANTWTYNFAASENSTSLNFPVSGATAAPVRVNCYVWRPSTSTKIGTVLDGNTASNQTEGSANQVKSHHTTFTGAAVASMVNGDVLIFEVWFTIDPALGALVSSFYYDGTTVNTTRNVTVTNHASFLETPQTLTFLSQQHFDRTVGESLSITDSPAKMKRAFRTTPNSLTITASPVRLQKVRRTLTNTVTITATPLRVYKTVRSVSNSLTIVTNAIQDKSFARSVSESFIIQDPVNRLAKLRRVLPESVALSSVIGNRVRRVPRTILEPGLSITDNVSKAKRWIRTASNSLTVSASAVRSLYRARRTIIEPFTITASPARRLAARRTAAATAVIVDSIARRKRAIVPISDTLTITANVVRILRYRRTLIESMSMNALTTRLYKARRTINQPIAITGLGEGRILQSFARSVNDSLILTGTGNRIRRVPRIINQTVAIATVVFQKLCRSEDFD